MQRRNVFTLIGLLGCADLVGLSGCAPLGRPLPEPRPTQVHASFNKTWNAAVNYFAESGILLDTTERSSGVIRADAATMPRDKSHFGLCDGNSMLDSYWEAHGGWRWSRTSEARPVGAPFTAIIHGDSTRTTVRITADWIDANGKEVKCSKTTNSWEQQTEAAIKTKAERR
jgi:hypothetical protein